MKVYNKIPINEGEYEIIKSLERRVGYEIPIREILIERRYDRIAINVKDENVVQFEIGNLKEIGFPDFPEEMFELKNLRALVIKEFRSIL